MRVQNRPNSPVTLVAGLVVLFLAVQGPGGASHAAQSDDGPGGDGQPHIDYVKHVLDNGLTLIMHEDHKAPIVAVNVWYHVGSKNERSGKTGFAHLFEHLMFNGSEHHDDDYFAPFDRVGATDMNGTTSADRTNYFQNVPTTALDMALWMESDRMGHLLGAIDQAKLDEQRGVVQNEKRQGENQPYGQVFNLLVENSYPEGHPYSWPVIGRMEDLDAATLDDVRDWFQSYYGAANAVIAIAGDIDPEAVKARVEHYFGDIPSGPPVTQHATWIAKRTASHRQIIPDRVPQARLIKAWNIPEIGSADSDFLELAADVLASGKNSRLYKRLVYEDQIATDVTAFAWLREIGGQFVVWATAKPGRDLAAVEKALDEEMARFLDKGPEKRELQRVKVQQRAAFLRGIERIGGFGGKSDILARSEVYEGSPDAYRQSLARIQAASRADVRDAARRWLLDGVYVLEVHPFPEYRVMDSQADRSRVPEPGEAPEVSFPKLQRTKLANGLEIILAEHHSIPVLQLQLLLDAGYAADQLATPGTASLVMNMLDEGTQGRSALEISEELALLGAELSTGSNLDMSAVTLSALTENLDPSLEIFADVILNPAFSEPDFERLRNQQLAAIQREKTTPRSMVLRVFPRLFYGEGHAYGIPFTGSGDEQSVSSLTRDQLRSFHQTWFRPNNAVMVVVGDTTLEEITPRLETLFRGWEPREVPDKNLARVPQASHSTVYILDRPDSLQSLIFTGHLAPPPSDPRNIAIEVANEVLGGSFSARVNMNLREDKHWSYGAYSSLPDARGQRPFIVQAPVQTDKTKQAMHEIQRELRDIAGPRPPTEQELTRAKDKKTLTLPGRWETATAVRHSVAEIVRHGLPDDYWIQYPHEIRQLDPAEVSAVAADVIHPDRLIWVVVGDRDEIEPGIRELALGEVVILDATGTPVEGVEDPDEPSP